jgi:hypothetical protein
VYFLYFHCALLLKPTLTKKASVTNNESNAFSAQESRIGALVYIALVLLVVSITRFAGVGRVASFITTSMVWILVRTHKHVSHMHA